MLTESVQIVEKMRYNKKGATVYVREHSGMFVTFEGIDGSGKTTQLQALKNTLINAGRDVLLVREPGGTFIGEKIRSVLLDTANTGMSRETEILLYEAARSQIVREVIRPALLDGKIVICDRFYDSSVAYQGYGRGLDLDDVSFLNRFATGGLEPDLTFLLDIPAADARARMHGREEVADRLEIEGHDFMETVRQGYLDLAAKNNRFVCLDARDSATEIEKNIERKFWEVLQR